MCPIGKISLPVAQKKSHKFDLSTSHITTQDFFQMRPIYIHECVPGEHLAVDMSTFSRLDPLIRPAYGNARIVNRAFFVPMRTIMSGWNEFITQTVQVTNRPINENVPHTTTYILATVLTDTAFSTQTSTPETLPWDFLLDGNYYKLTKDGAMVYKLLQSLGYNLSFANLFSSTGKYISIMPILAYLRIYFDYYRNKQFYSDYCDKYFSAEYRGKPYSERFTKAELVQIMKLIPFVNYRNDYFTSAFKSPVIASGADTGSLNTQITLNDYPTSYSGIQGDTKVTNWNDEDEHVVIPSLRPTETYDPLQGLTQYALDSLKALTNFMYRNSIAGARPLDRFLARYGKKLPDAVLNQSTYLGKQVSSIDIADVTSMSDTGSSQAILGQQAGKGISYNGKDGHFDYSTDEFGYFVIVSVVEVDFGYYEGRPRMLQHLSPLDFFTPEFDALGMQVLRRDELYADDVDGSGLSESERYASSLFGYQSRYAEYKCQPYDMLTGDFRIRTRNAGLDSYHMLRKVQADGPNYLVPTIGPGFQKADGEQFDRIFNYQYNDYDHMTTIFRFKVTAWLPMAPLFDDYNLDNQHDQNGQRVEQHVHGQRF